MLGKSNQWQKPREKKSMVWDSTSSIPEVEEESNLYKRSVVYGFIVFWVVDYFYFVFMYVWRVRRAGVGFWGVLGRGGVWKVLRAVISGFLLFGFSFSCYGVVLFFKCWSGSGNFWGFKLQIWGRMLLELHAWCRFPCAEEAQPFPMSSSWKFWNPMISFQ